MEIKDSFGQVIDIGDYLVFATKTRYLGSLGIGRVTKITTKGRIAMRAVITYGKNFADAVTSEVELRERLIKGYKDQGKDIPDWAFKHDPGDITFKQNLSSASTCYKIPGYALPIDITQALDKGD